MPSVFARWVILVFWLAMTGWLFQREILPKLTATDEGYDSFVDNRGIEESSHWTVRLNGQQVGWTLTTIKPMADRSVEFITDANFRFELSSANSDQPALPTARLALKTSVRVDPKKHLERFQADIRSEDTKLELHVLGVVEGNELVLNLSGLPGDNKPIRIPITQEMVIWDSFGPIDRIPNLTLGKKWKTRSVNPMPALVSQFNPFSSQRGPTVEVVQHEVVDSQSIQWNKRSWLCYVVQHQYDRMTTRTWVRTTDGKVLRHESPVLAMMMTLELDVPMDQMD